MQNYWIKCRPIGLDRDFSERITRVQINLNHAQCFKWNCKTRYQMEVGFCSIWSPSRFMDLRDVKKHLQ